MFTRSGSEPAFIFRISDARDHCGRCGTHHRTVGGFLWLLPTILVCLVWSTYNAWNLTITAAEQQHDTH